MKLRRQGGCLKIALAFLGGSAVLISWAEFIFKPLRHYARQENLSFGDALTDLMRVQPSAYDWPFSGYVFLITSAIILYFGFVLLMRPVRAALDFIEGSESPVSILESNIELYMNDADMNVCTTRREQILHANGENVDAYHYGQQASRGKLKKEKLKIESRINGVIITKDLLKRGDEKSLDTIERFTEILPVNFFATYFPDSLVLFLHRTFGFFNRSLVKRICSSEDSGEYSHQFPMYQLIVARYPVSKISIVLNFPVGSVYITNTAKAFLILNHAVMEIPVTPFGDDNSREKLRIGVEKLRPQQTLRVIWENNV